MIAGSNTARDMNVMRHFFRSNSYIVSLHYQNSGFNRSDQGGDKLSLLSPNTLRHWTFANVGRLQVDLLCLPAFTGDTHDCMNNGVGTAEETNDHELVLQMVESLRQGEIAYQLKASQRCSRLLQTQEATYEQGRYITS